MLLRELSEKYQKKEEELKAEHMRVEGKLHFLLYLQTRYSGDFEVDSDIVFLGDDGWRDEMVRSIQKQQAERVEDALDEITT